MTREQLARAAVDGVACGLVDALDALRAHAPVHGRIVLVGGLARSVAFRRVFAGLVDVPIVVSDAEQAVATGAAVQAAAVLEQVDAATIQQRWGLGGGTPIEEGLDPGDLRERYAELRRPGRWRVATTPCARSASVRTPTPTTCAPPAAGWRDRPIPMPAATPRRWRRSTPRRNGRCTSWRAPSEDCRR